MISENTGIFLHDRATRGEILSDEEQTLLHDWYKMQDKIETELLGLNSEKSEGNLQRLRTQVETSLKKLIAVTQQIQCVTNENESLKQEISVLHCRLTQQFVRRSV